MKAQNIVIITVISLFLTSPSYAGFKLIPTFNSFTKVVRGTIDPGHYRDKAKKEARNKITKAKNIELSKISKKISKLEKELINLRSIKASVTQFNLKKAEINFVKSIKRTIETEFNRLLSTI